MSVLFHAFLKFLVLVSMCLHAAPIAAETRPATPVIVARVTSSPVVERVEALGTLRANESVTLTANVTDTVSAIHFEDGQRVAQDQLLLEMTSSEEHAMLEEARARVTEAARQYERTRPLVVKGTDTESILDERKRDVETSKAMYAAIESRLADRLIKAPFAGVLGLRNISRGSLLRPGDPIITLDDDSVMKLDFSIPSVYLGALHTGLGIEAKARALGARSFEGEVHSIDSRIDPVTRSIQVRALIPNPDLSLRPGMLMQVVLLRNPRQGLVIPEAALLQKGREHFVMLIGEDGTVAQRQVSIGIRRPGEVEIITGLSADDRVITHGNDRVRPGQAVAIQAVDDGSMSLKEMLEQPR